jgi:predicted dehydrogenase
MAKQIKVGVVGCGYWGPNLIRNFRSLPDCTMKMMCDVSENRLGHLKALYPEVEGEQNYNHMLNPTWRIRAIKICKHLQIKAGLG